MSSDRIIVVVFVAVAIALFLLSIVTHQGERIYDRKGPGSVAWWWLRTFRVETTRKNCARFVTITSLGGIVMCSGALLLLLLK